MRRVLLRLAAAGAIVACSFAWSLAERASAAAWCGIDAAEADRPDTMGGPRFHLIYAVPADGADRFGETAPKIVTDVGVVLSWWAREDPVHLPRFDVAAFPGCPSPVEALDISFARLSQPSSAYHQSASRLDLLARELATRFSDPIKKYVAFYDGAVADEDLCGSALGRNNPTGGGPFALSALYIQNRPSSPGCGLFGTETYTARTLAHEMLHMIGAVPNGAPNACAAHICSALNDVMASNGCCARLTEYALDIGRDDYYGHGSAWLDTQDSRWLTQAPDRTITVTLSGAAGAESVVSENSAGIDCPRVCSLPWAGGERVALRPHAGPKTRFLRWQGDCTGTDACIVRTDADRSVTAVFGPSSYPVTLTLKGSGSISSSWATCRRSCRFAVDADARITLRARAARGWRFAGWQGGCASTGKKLTCIVRMTRARSATAIFRRLPKP